MKKTLLSFFLIFISLLSFAQNPFVIKGTFKNFNGMIYLNYYGKTDSTFVRDGNFEFKGEIDLPVKADLKIRTVLSLAQTPFIIDPAELEIKVDTSTVSGGKPYVWLNATVTKGGATTELINNFHEQIRPKVMAAKTNDEKVKYITEEAKLFMKNNPDKVAPLYVISTAQKQFSLIYLKELYFGLSDKLKNTSFGQIIKSRIEKDEQAVLETVIADFEQEDLNGNKVSIKSLRGKYVLIDFWASWCSPCREENPNLVKLYEKYKAKGFEILGVSLDENKESWIAALKADNLSWVHVSDLKGWNNAVSRQFKINAIPDNILIDGDGKIVAKNLRGEKLEEKLKELF